jgi:hypothetical protein
MVKSTAIKCNRCHIATVITSCGRSQTICNPSEQPLTTMLGLPTGPHVLKGWQPPTTLTVLSRHNHLHGHHDES